MTPFHKNQRMVDREEAEKFAKGFSLKYFEVLQRDTPTMTPIIIHLFEADQLV
jgi:hypothetical protein